MVATKEFSRGIYLVKIICLKFIKDFTVSKICCFLSGRDRYKLLQFKGADKSKPYSHCSVFTSFASNPEVYNIYLHNFMNFYNLLFITNTYTHTFSNALSFCELILISYQFCLVES